MHDNDLDAATIAEYTTIISKLDWNCVSDIDQGKIPLLEQSGKLSCSFEILPGNHGSVETLSDVLHNITKANVNVDSDGGTTTVTIHYDELGQLPGCFGVAPYGMPRPRATYASSIGTAAGKPGITK